MNKVILTNSRLTRDPEIRYSTKDKTMMIARYTLANNRRKNRDGSQEADFISCICFGKTAEFAEKYLHKGTAINVTGRIQTGSYTDKNGKKQYTTDVVVEEHEFPESNGKPVEKESGFESIPAGVEEELPFE